MIDLSADALRWVRAAPGLVRMRAYMEGAQRARPWSDAVFAMSGYEGPSDSCPGPLAALVNQDLAPLDAFLSSDVPARIAGSAAADFERLTGLASPDIVLLAGCFGSNACQARGPDGFAAVLCLEHCCNLLGSLRLSETQARAWLVHELAHCSRYEATGLQCEPGRLAERLGEMTLRERIADEGIASALQCESQPAQQPASLMAFEQGDIEAIHARSGDLIARAADEAESGHALFMMPGRPDGLPSRWGYVLGRTLALDALQRLGSWEALLAAPATDILKTRGGAS